MTHTLKIFTTRAGHELIDTREGPASSLFRHARTCGIWSLTNERGELVEDSHGWYEHFGELRCFEGTDKQPVDSQRLKSSDACRVDRVEVTASDGEYSVVECHRHQFQFGDVTAASLLTSWWADGAFLYSLLVQPPFRKQGVATQLMKNVCEEADVQGVTLYLVPEAHADMPVGNETLREMYSKLGFVDEDDPDTPNLMKRVPSNGKESNEEEAVSATAKGEADSQEDV